MCRSRPSPFEVAEPDLRPLSQALAKCGIATDRILYVAKQLSRPPVSLGQSVIHDPGILPGMEIAICSELEKGEWTSSIQVRPVAEIGSPPLNPREFDPDVAARLLRLDEGHPDPDAKWKKLSPAERKRARRLWDWTGKAHGLSVAPQGRPPVIDPALVLYCIRFLCEESGRSKFNFSRPTDGGPPGGPMWRALIEALPIAQQFLAIRYGTPAISHRQIGAHAEAIAEVAKLIRTKHFEKWCRLIGACGSSSADVAANPAVCRAAVYYARKSRSHKRRGRR
jgi:hypothetical protein